MTKIKVKSGDSKKNGHSKTSSKSKLNKEKNPHIEQLREKFLKVVDKNLLIGDDEKVCFGWQGITYKHKTVKKKCCKVVDQETKYILKDVSGIAEPGRLVVCSLNSYYYV